MKIFLTKDGKNIYELDSVFLVSDTPLTILEIKELRVDHSGVVCGSNCCSWRKVSEVYASRSEAMKVVIQKYIDELIKFINS